MQSTDLQVIKEIPGYKVILKAVLKTQIQQLVEQLADHTGEESVILTASVSDGSLSHLGSESGKVFLEDHDDIKSQFLGFCLKRHHRQKQIEVARQQETQLDPGGKIQNSGPAPHRMGAGPRPRFAPTRVHPSPRQASPRFQTPRQSFHNPNQSGVHPVSLTQASPQGAGRGGLGQRHQPYPANHKKQSPGAMKLPTDPTKSRKSLTPGKGIKTEPLTGALEDNGESVSQGASLSGNSDSSENQTTDAMPSESTLTQSAPSDQDTAVVKSESSELSSEPTDGTFSEIQLPQGLGLESDSNTSVQEPLTSGELDSDANESINVKVEAGDDDMDLEITGVEPGQMAPSDTDWMSTVQTGMEFDPSVSGASNQSGQEYDNRFPNQPYGKKRCAICGKYILQTSMTNHLRLHRGERNYSCTICEKSFVQKANYQGHMYRKHNMIV